MLFKCSKVEKYLLENSLMDERRIWCYAEMRAQFATKHYPFYAFVLVCVNGEKLYLFVTKFNSTVMDLYYECKIDELQDVSIKKKLLNVARVSFVNKSDKIKLDMQKWNQFSSLIKASN